MSTDDSCLYPSYHSSLFPFHWYLLPDLLFNLFESFQEELFHIASLIQNDLRQGFDSSMLLHFTSHHLSQVKYVFLLFSDDLFMLEPHKLLFLLKVFHDLSQRLLKQLDLWLQYLYLFLLVLSSLVVLIHCSQIQHHVTLMHLVFIYVFLLLALVIVQWVPLAHGLLSQFLVLMMDITLNVLDVYRRIIKHK